MAAKEAEPINSKVVGTGCSDAAAHGHSPRKSLGKQKRIVSSEGKHARGGGRGGGRYYGHRPPHKKAKLNVSSTRAANNIMKFRLGGSVSDPLNLEGGDNLGDDCSTCAPSPVLPANEELIPTPLLLTTHLNKDPLNLEGKVKNFPLLGVGSSTGGGRKAITVAGQRRKPRRRTTSGSKAEDTTAAIKTSETKSVPKDGKFCYGNYNRYYSYRNSSVNEADPRVALLHKEWLEGQDCLDIGCNTGQVTIKLAMDMCPRKIVGLDIDHNLIKMAWKNLHRSCTPSLTPDGRPFPSSLTMSRGSVDFPPTATIAASGSGQSSSATLEPEQQERGNAFPYNIQFVHDNYVPKDDACVASQTPQYDVILALSLSKWIHLNWGDSGIKRFFKKVYQHLRPGGKFILEPQPFSSYSKKKKLNEEIFKNYQSIAFRPHQFHSYLLSKDVGFSSHRFLGVADNKSKGFQRPIHMYIKAKDETTTSLVPSLPCPHSAMSCTSETGRLKSVVQVVSTQPHAQLAHVQGTKSTEQQN